MKNRWLKYLVIILLALIAGWTINLLGRFSLPLFIAVIFLILASIKIFQNPVNGLILTAFFLPFERIGSYDLWGVTIRLSQILALITIAAWILSMLINNRIKLAKNPLVLPLFFFLLINLTSLLNAPNLGKSILVLAFTIFTILVGLIVPNLIKSEKALHRIVMAILYSSLVVSIFGIYQFAGDMLGLPETLTGLRPQYTKIILGFTRVQSTALEPLYFANYLLLPLSLALSLFLSKGKKLSQGLLLSVIGLGLLNLILTASRGGYLAFIGSFFVVAAFYWRQIFKLKIIIPGLIIILLIIFALPRMMGLDASQNPIQSNLSKLISHSQDLFGGAAYEERMERYSQALALWRKHPLVGSGPGSFGAWVSDQPYEQPEIGWAIVNNEPLELLAETGIFGLVIIGLAILWLLIKSFLQIFKTEDKYLKSLLTALTANLLAVIIQYQTFSILYIIHIWFAIGLLVAVYNLSRQKNAL